MADWCFADTVVIPSHQLLHAKQHFDFQLPAVQRDQRRLLVDHPMRERDICLLSRQYLPVVVDLVEQGDTVGPDRDQGATRDREVTVQLRAVGIQFAAALTFTPCLLASLGAEELRICGVVGGLVGLCVHAGGLVWWLKSARRFRLDA